MLLLKNIILFSIVVPIVREIFEISIYLYIFKKRNNNYKFRVDDNDPSIFVKFTLERVCLLLLKGLKILMILLCLNAIQLL